jgi:hypothetical protein
MLPTCCIKKINLIQKHTIGSWWQAPIFGSKMLPMMGELALVGHALQPHKPVHYKQFQDQPSQYSNFNKKNMARYKPTSNKRSIDDGAIYIIIS